MHAPSPRWRPGWAALGLVLVATYLALDQVPGGLQVRFQRPFTHIAAGEHMFWLAHCALLLPGLGALAWGLAPLTRRLGGWVAARVVGASAREARIGLVALAVLAVVAYRLGHLAFLADLPFTDDEWGARFGGQVLASGAFLVELPLPQVVPKVYLFESAEGLVTSMDWPGLVLSWALAEATGAGPWLFALWAAVPLVALPWAAGQRWGREAAVAAAVIVLVSPMILALSLTTHVHVVSRGCLAIGLCGYVVGRSGGGRSPWLVAGFALGFGLITRPFETGALVLPLAASELWQAVRGDATARRALLCLLPGVLAAGAWFAFYNTMVTGHWASPARMSSAGNLEPIAVAADGLGLVWHRLGNNLGFNLLLLGVFFLGPFGVAAVVAGAEDPLSRRILAGVGLLLLVGLAHNNTGVHAVGPIHYADAAVPLTLVAARGGQRLLGWLGRWPAVAASVALTAVVGYAAFGLHQARALGAQADVHARIYGPFADPALPRSVVMAQQYARYWLADPEAKALGTWVFDWRRPDPRGLDHVVFVHDLPGAEPHILAAYPDRAAFRLALTDAPPFMKLTRVR